MTKALQPDDLIAHYRVIRALGAGGMGEVCLARDKNQVSNLWRWTVAAAKPEPLTDFRSGLVVEFSASQDGKTIHFTQGSLHKETSKSPAW